MLSTKKYYDEINNNLNGYNICRFLCRWAEALKLATRAEVPSPNDVSGVEESTSLSSSSKNDF